MFRGMATLLYIITEGIQGGPFELTEGTHILGSAEGSTILISDTTISAQHGQFTISDGKSFIRIWALKMLASWNNNP